MSRSGGGILIVRSTKSPIRARALHRGSSFHFHGYHLPRGCKFLPGGLRQRDPVGKSIFFTFHFQFSWIKHSFPGNDGRALQFIGHCIHTAAEKRIPAEEARIQGDETMSGIGILPGNGIPGVNTGQDSSQICRGFRTAGSGTSARIYAVWQMNWSAGPMPDKCRKTGSESRWNWSPQRSIRIWNKTIFSEKKRFLLIYPLAIFHFLLIYIPINIGL